MAWSISGSADVLACGAGAGSAWRRSTPAAPSASRRSSRMRLEPVGAVRVSTSRPVTASSLRSTAAGASGASKLSSSAAPISSAGRVMRFSIPWRAASSRGAGVSAGSCGVSRRVSGALGFRSTVCVSTTASATVARALVPIRMRGRAMVFSMAVTPVQNPPRLRGRSDMGRAVWADPWRWAEYSASAAATASFRAASEGGGVCALSAFCRRSSGSSVMSAPPVPGRATARAPCSSAS